MNDEDELIQEPILDPSINCIQLEHTIDNQKNSLNYYKPQSFQ